MKTKIKLPWIAFERVLVSLTDNFDLNSSDQRTAQIRRVRTNIIMKDLFSSMTIGMIVSYQMDIAVLAHFQDDQSSRSRFFY